MNKNKGIVLIAVFIFVTIISASIYASYLSYLNKLKNEFENDYELFSEMRNLLIDLYDEYGVEKLYLDDIDDCIVLYGLPRELKAEERAIVEAFHNEKPSFGRLRGVGGGAFICNEEYVFFIGDTNHMFFYERNSNVSVIESARKAGWSNARAYRIRDGWYLVEKEVFYDY